MVVHQKMFNYEKILLLLLDIFFRQIFEHVINFLLEINNFLLFLLILVFIPHVKRFFDENLILSTGYTARETLKLVLNQ